MNANEYVEPELEPKWCSMADAKRILGASDSFMRRAIKAGEIQAYRMGPRDFRFLIADLDSLMTPVDPTKDYGQ